MQHEIYLVTFIYRPRIERYEVMKETASSYIVNVRGDGRRTIRKGTLTSKTFPTKELALAFRREWFESEIAKKEADIKQLKELASLSGDQVECNDISRPWPKIDGPILF